MPVEIQLLGTGDAFGDGGRRQACIFLGAGDVRALLDCGATSLLALKASSIDPSEIDLVAISHFHGDHFGGVPYLILDGQFRKRTRPLTIVGPVGIEERTRREMEQCFPGSSITPQRFGIVFHELGARPSTIGPMSLAAFPALHTPGADAIALRISLDGRVLAYSGDTQWIPELAALSAEADLLICEAYSFDKRIPFHLDYRSLVEHRAEISARRVLLTHLGPDLLANIGQVELECAHDGMTLEL